MTDLALVTRDLAEARAEADADLLDAQRLLYAAQEDAARLAARVGRLTARRARLRFLAEELVGLGLVPAPAPDVSGADAAPETKEQEDAP